MFKREERGRESEIVRSGLCDQERKASDERERASEKERSGASGLREKKSRGGGVRERAQGLWVKK